MSYTEILILLLVVLPVVSYMVMKFGTSGFLRAKRKDKEKEKNTP